MNPGSLRDHFGAVLESFLGRFDPILRLFWTLFWLLSDRLRPILGHFYGHFATFFVNVLGS